MTPPTALDRFLAAGGIPIAAGLAFGGQFLVSLRGANPMATILPGAALYLLAAATMLLALRARCLAARAARDAGDSPVDPGAEAGAEPGAVEERYLAGRAGWILLAVIVAVGAYLRLERIDTLPSGLNNDEAINAIEAREIVAGKPFRSVTERGLNRETMFHHLAALSYEHPGLLLNFLRAMPGVFGLEPKFVNDRLQDMILPLRAVSIVVGIVTIALVGFVGSAWFGWRAGLIAALFLAVSPWHLLYSRVGLRTILAPPFALLAAWLFLRAWRSGKWLWPVLWGVAVGLGFWTYTSFRVAPMAMAAFAALALLAGRRAAGAATAKRRPAAEAAPAPPPIDRRGLYAGAGIAAVILMLLAASSGLGVMGFLARGAYATTPPKTSWMANLFHSVTMLNYEPARYAVIQDDSFISDGISAAYPLIGLEPDTLLLAAFATLGMILAVVKGFGRRAHAGAGGGAPAIAADAARLLVLMLLAGWLTVGWLGPSLTRMLVLLPFFALAGGLFAARFWESLAGLWRPVSTFVAAAAMLGVAGLALAQGYSNLFILAARSDRAMQHFGAVQTIMGMFARSLPPEEDVVVLHTLRVDTLRYLIGDRPHVTMLTDTTKVSLESIIAGPRNVTFVIEYARPFAEPLRGLMMRFPTGDMTQVADARIDPDKPIFFTFTIFKDASGNVVPAPDAASPGMSTGAPVPPGMSTGSPEPPPGPPPGS